MFTKPVARNETIFSETRRIDSNKWLKKTTRVYNKPEILLGQSMIPVFDCFYKIGTKNWHGTYLYDYDLAFYR